MALVEKFGEHLLNQQEKVDISTLGEYPYVALYFSAMWCPQCKFFTKKLEKLYNSANESEKQLQIILISSDETEEDFEEYYEDHPWLAVQFDQEKNTELFKDYGIEGMPGLVLIDKKGEIITKKFKEMIMNDGNAAMKNLKDEYPVA